MKDNLSLSQAGWLYLLAMVAYGLVGGATQMRIGAGPQAKFWGWLAGLATAIALIFLLLRYWKVDRRPVLGLKAPTRSDLSGSLSLVGLQLLVQIPLAMALAALIKTDVRPDLDWITSGLSPLGMAVIMLAVSLFEEFTFRGYLFSAARCLGDYPALLLTSAFFALNHGLTFPTAFIFGLVVGMMRLVTGSIWPAVLIHFVNNWGAALLSNAALAGRIALSQLGWGVIILSLLVAAAGWPAIRRYWQHWCQLRRESPIRLGTALRGFLTPGIMKVNLIILVLITMLSTVAR
ncbi:MAG: CPBP family intramembrane glutamic endopeptidase [Bacillota bacterium]